MLEYTNNKTQKELLIELKQGIYSALKTYSNVHRGRSHNSMITTYLFEKARNIVLSYLGLSKWKYVVIFLSPRIAEILKKQLKSKDYICLSSEDIGIPLGIRVLIVKRRALPKGNPSYSGGGTARLISRDWVVWAKKPDKFEAGTPAIINIIAFAKALQIMQKYKIQSFQNNNSENINIKNLLYHDEFDNFSGKELRKKLHQTLIGKDVIVPTIQGNKNFINLDNAASTQTFEPVWKTFYQSWNALTQTRNEIIKNVKSVSAEFLGAPSEKYDVIFTTNTTEAINIVTENLLINSVKNNETVVLNTLLEHNSNELSWRTKGFSLMRLPINSEGFINLNELDTVLKEYNQIQVHSPKRIKLVTISGASNVLGVYNDLSKISQIVHQYGAELLVDAAQLVAHRQINMGETGIDYLAFSAHKVYAPFGSGALVAKKGLLNFNEDEMLQIRLSGEENIGGIAALGKAFLLLKRIGFDVIQEEEKALTIYALNELKKIPGITVHGIQDVESSEINKKGGLIVFHHNQVFSHGIAKKLALYGGIGIRSGCHCAHILIKHILHVSPSLERFQHSMVSFIPAIDLPGVARISFGIQNKKEDIDACITALYNITQHQQALIKKGFAMPKDKVKQLVKNYIKESSYRIYN